MYFQYGEAETAYLSARDERMAAVIAQAGHIEREVDTDLFSAVVHHIVGQQISMKAQATIWKRMRDEFGVVDAAAVLGAGVEKLQSFGMTITAEGVETSDQVEFLKNLHCDDIQGYYFSKPLPVNEFEDFVRKHTGL